MKRNLILNKTKKKKTTHLRFKIKSKIKIYMLQQTPFPSFYNVKPNDETPCVCNV